MSTAPPGPSIRSSRLILPEPLPIGLVVSVIRTCQFNQIFSPAGTRRRLQPKALTAVVQLSSHRGNGNGLGGKAMLFSLDESPVPMRPGE